MSCTIAPVESVQLLRLRVDLHADARRRLVDEIDGLVGELTVGDVAVRERRGRDDRRVGDLDLVMDRVTLLQAAQDGDRVLDRGLVDQHGLKAPLERGVLLDVLAVLVERGRADAVQLAACERGLQHVARVHGALGLAGADHGVQLVDEQDHAAFLLGEVVEHRLEPLLELAAELGARDQGAHVEGEDALVAQALRDLAVDDPESESLDDRGLADARLADQHGVVLGAPLQHLDGAADFIVAADDRVELALLGALGQIDGVFLERLAALLGIRIVDLLPAAQVLDSALERALHDAGIAENGAQRALVVERREHEQLARYVLVTALLRELVSEVEQLRQVIREMHLAPGPLDRGQAIERLAELGAQRIEVRARLVEQRPYGAAFLVEQRQHEMRGLDELVIPPERHRLGVGQCYLELAGQFVLAHDGSSLLRAASPRDGGARPGGQVRRVALSASAGG